MVMVMADMSSEPSSDLWPVMDSDNGMDPKLIVLDLLLQLNLVDYYYITGSAVEEMVLILDWYIILHVSASP